MAFEPVRMTAPDGRAILVGSATEREHLLAHGYRVAEAPKPVAKPEPKPVVKRADLDKK